MIFVFTVSTKVSSTSWDLTSVDHQAHWDIGSSSPTSDMDEVGGS